MINKLEEVIINAYVEIKYWQSLRPFIDELLIFQWLQKDIVIETANLFYQKKKKFTFNVYISDSFEI